MYVCLKYFQYVHTAHEAKKYIFLGNILQSMELHSQSHFYKQEKKYKYLFLD